MAPSPEEPEDRELRLATDWLATNAVLGLDSRPPLAESLAVLLCRYRAEVLEEVARGGL